MRRKGELQNMADIPKKSVKAARMKWITCYQE
jgi:hypothetical protein